MRKLIGSLLFVMIVLVLSACGASKEESQPSNSNTPSTTAPTSAPTSAPTAEPNKADGYPKDTIKIIVGRAAGGATDVTARLVADALKESLGVPVVVMNKEGGDGAVGANEGIKAKPDGYTITAIGSTEIPNLLVNGQGITWGLNDFKTVAQVTSRSFIFALKKGSQFKTLDEVIDYAKNNPGKLTFGIPASGNINTATLIMEELGIEATIVNTGGGNQNYTQLLGGHIEMGILGEQFYGRSIEEGLTVLGITNDQKEAKEGAAPSFVSQGYDNVISMASTIIIAPKDTPDEITKVLSDAIEQAILNGNLKENLEKSEQNVNFKGAEEINKVMPALLQKEIEILEAIKSAQGK